MSEGSAETFGLRLVPVWWPILTAFLAAVFSAGATYTTIGFRISTLETRVTSIEVDRKETLREWSVWRNATDQREQRHEDSIDHVVKTVDRIADKLGVIH